MMRVAAIALAFALCVATQVGNAQTSQFKGWYVVTNELSTRIAPKGAPLDLDRFLPGEDMEDLLGTWFRFGGEHIYQNGLPNSVNMVIWHVCPVAVFQEHGGLVQDSGIHISPALSCNVEEALRLARTRSSIRAGAARLLAQRHGLQRARRRISRLA